MAAPAWLQPRAPHRCAARCSRRSSSLPRPRLSGLHFACGCVGAGSDASNHLMTCSGAPSAQASPCGQPPHPPMHEQPQLHSELNQQPGPQAQARPLPAAAPVAPPAGSISSPPSLAAACHDTCASRAQHTKPHCTQQQLQIEVAVEPHPAAATAIGGASVSSAVCPRAAHATAASAPAQL
jgi:hypothetical protein